MLKGAPHIWTHNEVVSMIILLTVIPFFHCWSMRSWLSNDQGPPLKIRFISNSNWNLNWNKFGPTSRICIVSSTPQSLRIVLFAAILLNGLHARNFPIRLKWQLSRASSLSSFEIAMISSSSYVSFIFSILSMTSSAMILWKRKNNTLRTRPREGGTCGSTRERELHTRERFFFFFLNNIYSIILKILFIIKLYIYIYLESYIYIYIYI